MKLKELRKHIPNLKISEGYKGILECYKIHFVARVQR